MDDKKIYSLIDNIEFISRADLNQDVDKIVGLKNEHLQNKFNGWRFIFCGGRKIRKIARD